MNSRTLKQVVAVIALLFAIATSIGTEAAKIDVKAVQLLKAMSDKLSAAKEIRFVLRRTVDVGLFEGVDVTETVRGEVYLRRPNKLAARITTEGSRRQLVYDGARISILDLEAKRFATVPPPAPLTRR